jgi:hypothetical protein
LCGRRAMPSMTHRLLTIGPIASVAGRPEVGGEKTELCEAPRQSQDAKQSYGMQ